jgi:hypothetical protein
MILPALLFLFGVLTWSFAEYLLHRFAFHEQRGSWKGSTEHPAAARSDLRRMVGGRGR